jgi:hypothetical protein
VKNLMRRVTASSVAWKSMTGSLSENLRKYSTDIRGRSEPEVWECLKTWVK